jgi:hypothetical protein
MGDSFHFGGLVALRVFYRCVRSREHEGLMPVVVPDEVWRFTLPSPDLDDLGGLIRGTDNPSTHM